MMRIQSPKNMKQFEGKYESKELIISYIGCHRLLSSEFPETTVKEYLDSWEEFDETHMASFLTMFPYQLESYAKIFLEDFIKNKILAKK